MPSIHLEEREQDPYFSNEPEVLRSLITAARERAATWQTKFYEAEASHTEREGMLCQERVAAIQERDVLRAFMREVALAVGLTKIVMDENDPRPGTEQVIAAVKQQANVISKGTQTGRALATCVHCGWEAEATPETYLQLARTHSYECRSHPVYACVEAERKLAQNAVDQAEEAIAERDRLFAYAGALADALERARDLLIMKGTSDKSIIVEDINAALAAVPQMCHSGSGSSERDEAARAVESVPQSERPLSKRGDAGVGTGPLPECHPASVPPRCPKCGGLRMPDCPACPENKQFAVNSSEPQSAISERGQQNYFNRLRPK